mmetsp:Transcript_67511/g.112240  ORF Transcript_67511/g.112240 Transcript_67511/m.112240 type:complete len:257 (+) Transcript_67511:88-858(+)|eukprot:CAMPEP_0119316668 /NCGR_PEP_ID=MMETSP1333-20130426/40380_1 /TAXON_ID=418940 /ORGANISM="Scyphosphaera apsteinii, Strain RCC1455" /LENGTH=256 /DNA_ID=CAMNT_0007322371 /DNA_START=86 /DNA_END=856 /DNA_ORIENTATION=+
MPPTVTVVVVGDEATGKTCCLLSYGYNTFSYVHEPTTFDNFSTTALVDGKLVAMELRDTAGSDSYNRLRPLSYTDADVFLMIFSVTSRSSFERVASKWVHEVLHHKPGVPLVLVGTKGDLRRSDTLVLPEEAFELAASIGAVGYFECSAATQQGLKHVFDEAVRAGLRGTSRWRATSSASTIIEPPVLFRPLLRRRTSFSLFQSRTTSFSNKMQLEPPVRRQALFHFFRPRRTSDATARLCGNTITLQDQGEVTQV